MHLHFEKNNNAKCDCNILSLSWMGKVPDELPEDEGWKLNRTNYYQEGWLATGNARGLVGVTFTTSHCRTRASELPLRANYNLRGHRSEVILVKWNEPYQKLASCDSSGVIFVWIKYEGRWSIELINDRNTPVTYFSWSHDGRMALICYRDGFVLVGSVAGQRYWSSMLNDKAIITCGIWTPDDQQVYFGTTAGQLIVMDVHGVMVSEVQLSAGVTSMAWSAEKFKMEEGEEDVTDERTYVLAVCLADGNIVLLRSFDDVSPVTIRTCLKAPLHAEWSNSRKLLAIAGINDSEDPANNSTQEYANLLKFYSDAGTLVYTTAIPFTQCAVTALTWGHNDRRLFVATGARVHAAWVSRRVGSLQLLSRLAVRAALAKESSVQQLPLPPRLRALVAALFANTIRCCVPEPRELRRFVSRPPPGGGRLHCTMLRHAGEPAPCYTLYLEYLGGLVPLLKGRRTSKIRPEFVIFDPQTSNSGHSNGSEFSSHFPSCSDNSDNERETTDLCGGSPRNRRKNRRKFNYRNEERYADDNDDLAYVDTLPEHARLVEVTSNIWGTKFKIHGLASSVPANLGQVTYRTSLLHLQPRQMTLVITELRDDLPPGPDPTFNPNLFSEDEEENYLQEPRKNVRCSSEAQPPPIAPMTPRATRLNPVTRPKSQLSNQFLGESLSMPLTSAIARAENYETEFPFVELQDMTNFCETMRAASGGNYHRAYSPAPRHSAPRCCDVPALQSPKNAVAPTQTLIATSSPGADYAGNVQRMKTALADQQTVVNMKKDLETSSKNYTISAPSPDEDKPGLSLNHHTNGSSTSNNPSQTFVYSNGLTNFDNSISNCQSLVQSKNTVNANVRESNGLGTSACSRSQANSAVEDEEERHEVPALQNQFHTVHRTSTLVSIGPLQCSAESIVRSCSVGYLDLVDAQLLPCDVALRMLRKDAPNKRLFLVSRKAKQRRRHKDKDMAVRRNSKPKLGNCGKSRSLDSSDIFPSTEQISLAPLLQQHLEEVRGTSDQEATQEQESDRQELKVPKMTEPLNDSPAKTVESKGKLDVDVEKMAGPSYLSRLSPVRWFHFRGSSASNSLNSSLDALATRLGDFEDCHPLLSSSPRPSCRLPRSSPSSPAPSKKGKRPASASPIRRRLLSSPLLNRRIRKNRNESSDDEGLTQDDTSSSYRNLETFQKAQFRQKLKQRGITGNSWHKSDVVRHELVMHNKAPMWNESSQVYQLDFGGRVTQESAKNFQIEFRDKQVMQFGRIDGNAYTLDFQYPFSALQAFAVALANVTQRLK